MKRVISKVYKWYDSIIDDNEEIHYQYLQEKVIVKLFNIKLFFYWKTIDEEIVPSFAWIQHNTLGFTEWKSKWNDLENVNWDKI